MQKFLTISMPPFALRSATKERLRLVASAVLLFGAQAIHAQSIFGPNLIVNGDAEAGQAGTALTPPVASIPGWTRGGSGDVTVLPYNVTGYALLSDPAPPDHGFQYFIGAGYPSAVTLTETISVSSGASTIGGGNVKFTAAAYLGSSNPGDYHGSAQMEVAFQNSNGQTFSSVTLGPLAYPGSGMTLQQAIGLVPAGTTQIAVTLSFVGINGGNGAADSLSLVLTQENAPPGSVLGTNLVANGGAEAGPDATLPKPALYIPGWSTSGVTVAPYGGTNWIQTTDPGPLDRGVNLFCGFGAGSMYQDLDVSPAASLIDSGQVTFEVSAWLGGYGGQSSSPTLTYTFFDWSGNQLAATAQLGPTAGHAATELFEISHSGALPSGTRRVHIGVSFPGSAYMADDIAFVLAAPSGPPVITPGGIISAGAFGAFTDIAPGTWIEIYGTDLSSTTRPWAESDFTGGVAPTQLSGVSVSVGGQAAFLDYIGNGQVNALVPSNAPTGPVPVTVTNPNGTSDNFWITVNPTQPGLLAPANFVVGGKQYVAALLPDGQTFALPQGAVPGVTSSPASPGDTLTIYGIGFGPVNDGTTAGTVVTQLDSLTTPVEFFFGTTAATALPYYGLAPNFTGLYQFDVVVPKVAANNATPISITLGSAKGTQTLYIAVGN